MLLSIQSLLCDPFTKVNKKTLNIQIPFAIDQFLISVRKVCMEPELGRLYDQDRPRFDALARHWTKKYAMMDEISFDE